MDDFQQDGRNDTLIRTSDKTVLPDAPTAGENKLINPDEIVSHFLPGGGVEKTFGEGYEFRKEQQSVTREITLAFNGKSISLLEAPTGIGKTLSYLLPAAQWAVLNGGRVVISTNTINLQDQIIKKDMPMLREILGEEISYSLVKGMRNYLCLLRAETAKEDSGHLFAAKTGGAKGDAGADEEEKIFEWAQRTSSGTVSDLGFVPSEDVWDKFAAESESCTRKGCPHYKECFFFKARKKIAESNLIVVNHHLLFSDISIKDSAGRENSGILPPTRRIIIDEAHNVVDAATSHFTLQISNLAVLKTLNRLRKTVVYCAKLLKSLKKKSDPAQNGVVFKTLSGMKKVFTPRVERLETASEHLFDTICEQFRQAVAEKADSGEVTKIRVMENEMEDGGQWSDAAFLSAEIREHILSLSAVVKEAESVLRESGVDEVAKALSDLKAVSSGLERFGKVTDKFADIGAFAEFVKSVEIRQKSKKVFAAISISPINIAPNLKKTLYDRCDTLIMTSATLRAEGSFDFQKRSLGLEKNDRLSELAVPSPFNYRRQALLALANDLPEPSETAVYSKKITDAVRDCIRASRGGALVLFNSYRQLKKVSAEVSSALAEQGIKVLIQGQAPREKLLADFKADKNAALFGTDSFREGVDVPGDALRLVIITRLPFHVPTEPVFQARMEAIEARRGNAFGDYAVPMAVVNFRQAFGRLIRTAGDRGAVAVLDSRIVRRNYGKRFVDSVPDCRVVRCPLEIAVKEITDIFPQPSSIA